MASGADEPPGRPFRILSLDGGGILGAFTASFLADVERRLRCRIAEHFDLIAGTSTGGIIAAALAAGEPASRVVEFYRTRGPQIFTRQELGPWGKVLAFVPNILLARFGLDVQSLLAPSYGSEVLTASLDEVFGNRRIGELRTCRLLLTAVDLIQGKTVVFKTPHLERMIRDRHYRVAEAVASTAAAPTFFQPSRIGGKGAYADGGVWANNPTMVAVAEAIKISEACRRPCDPRFSLSSVYCLSIGTGRGQYIAKPKERAGIGWWLGEKKIITVMMTSQAQGVDFQAQYVLGDRYHRVDYTVPDRSWTLDNVGALDDLIDFGEKHVAVELPKWEHVFFRTKAEHYHPYPDAGDRVAMW